MELPVTKESVSALSLIHNPLGYRPVFDVVMYNSIYGRYIQKPYFSFGLRLLDLEDCTL